MKTFLICVYGILVYMVIKADCRNAISTLQNTQSENDQNIGDTCFAKLPFTCNPLYIYRMINGACTNLNFPYRGFVETALVRLLKAVNVDNTKMLKQSDGSLFNSARVLSNIFFTSLNDTNPNNQDKCFTLSMMQWAQLVTHDMVNTRGQSGDSCCTDKNQRKEVVTDNCVAIKVPTNDRFYSQFNRTCINMKRSINTDDIHCPISPSLPLNFVTSYIDASLLYGSTTAQNDLIRLKANGLMQFQDINGQMFPPNVSPNSSVCNGASNQDLCIQTGDIRANTHPMLGVMQTILLRTHNQLAMQLATLNPGWDDNRLFEESRRLVIAFIQHITFKFYLPNLIGQSYLDQIKCGLVKDTGYNDVYDPTVNTQVMTEFAGSVFRALHSSIVDKVTMYNDNRKPVSVWTFSSFYNNIGFISKDNNFEELVIGMTKDPQNNQDRHFAISVTDLLFQINGVGIDLESTDIERGREYLIPPYWEYLTMIGYPAPKSWADFEQYMDKNMVKRLQQRYKSFLDVELFIGGILEHNAPGSQVGPVFQAIIAEQFCRSQLGDRFYYEAKNQPRPFTDEQLKQIRKVTLSFLYCFATARLTTMQPDAFRLYSDQNNPIACKDIIGDFSLAAWKE